MASLLSRLCLRGRMLPPRRPPCPRWSSCACDEEGESPCPSSLSKSRYPLTLYGGRHTVTMIPGFGLGEEHCPHIEQVFKYANIPVDFELVTVDEDRTENTELDNAITAIKRNGVAIKGRVDTRSKDFNVKLGNVAIRHDLDLYAFVLCCKAYPRVPAKHKDLDIILVRENTQGEYALLEHGIQNDTVVEGLKIITEFGSRRVAKFAFELARRHGRKRVTIIHKANIMKLSDGLFLATCRKMASLYPDLKVDDMIVDNCCMQLVSRPQQFDVLLTPSLYGNVIGNLVCGLAGGPGLFSARSYGNTSAVFEPATRNQGTALLGTNRANPVAMLNAAVDMLRHLCLEEHALKLEAAVTKTICDDGVRTPDIGGTDTTEQVVDAVITNMLMSR